MSPWNREKQIGSSVLQSAELYGGIFFFVIGSVTAGAEARNAWCLARDEIDHSRKGDENRADNECQHTWIHRNNTIKLAKYHHVLSTMK